MMEHLDILVIQQHLLGHRVTRVTLDSLALLAERE
jgi:hypothetical protein